MSSERKPTEDKYLILPNIPPGLKGLSAWIPTCNDFFGLDRWSSHGNILSTPPASPAAPTSYWHPAIPPPPADTEPPPEPGRCYYCGAEGARRDRVGEPAICEEHRRVRK